MFFIPDKNLPIIIPFGYACIGKTMLIHRLIRYLRTIGYLVRPELVFRNDPIYSQRCEMYMDEVCGKIVPKGTEAILLSIIDVTGRPICYVLDISGEYQHDLINPLMGLSPEMTYIINLPNRKIWSFIIEAQSHLNNQERCHYVQKIHGVGSVMRKCDKVAFIISKVDCSNYYSWITDVSISDLYRFIETDYPHLFEPFTETHPILKWFKPKRFVLLPFSSGTFFQSCDDTGEKIECYCEGKDVYPQQLWNHWLKLLR